MSCIYCKKSAKWRERKNSKNMYCSKECIGLMMHLSNEEKEQFDNLPTMFMHGTRSPILVYMKHMKNPGVYSTGTLYKNLIFPMTGPLGGDITSKTENVGLEVVSGILKKDMIDRNVYYTTFEDEDITEDKLISDVSRMIEKRGEYYRMNKILGYISRLRYWDDEIYQKKFKPDIIKYILPLVPKDYVKVILSDRPVIQFTKEEKMELTQTYPIIFLSAKAAKESFVPQKRNIEIEEVYVKQLLIQDIDVVYTTNAGVKYVKKSMIDLGNNHALVIPSDNLFYESYRLSFLVGSLKPKTWESYLPKELWEKMDRSGMKPEDFEGASEKEIQEVLNELE